MLPYPRIDLTAVFTVKKKSAAPNIGGGGSVIRGYLAPFTLVKKNKPSGV
jgi:hypothetical protein